MSSRQVGYPARDTRKARNVKVADLKVGMETLSHRHILEIQNVNGTYFAVVQIGKSSIRDRMFLGKPDSEITIVEA